jgi:hypothetical protein
VHVLRLNFFHDFIRKVCLSFRTKEGRGYPNNDPLLSIFPRSGLGRPKNLFIALGRLSEIKPHEHFESHERDLECYVKEFFRNQH